MRRHLNLKLTLIAGAGSLIVAGCGAFHSQRGYAPYNPVTPAAVVWPSPLNPADEAEPAGYHEGPSAPATAPSTAPTTAPAATPATSPAEAPQ